MGYDMYIRGAEGDRGSDENYLRRNIWGGTHFAEALIDLGMGFNAEGTRPAWPEPDAFGVEWDDEGDVVGDRAAEFRAAEDAVKDWHGDDPGRKGIPVHKVAGTNDGWHVTKQECEQAVAAYREAMEAGRPHPKIFDRDAMPFLIRAAKHDGFETH